MINDKWEMENDKGINRIKDREKLVFNHYPVHPV